MTVKVRALHSEIRVVVVDSGDISWVSGWPGGGRQGVGACPPVFIVTCKHVCQKKAKYPLTLVLRLLSRYKYVVKHKSAKLIMTYAVGKLDAALNMSH